MLLIQELRLFPLREYRLGRRSVFQARGCRIALTLQMVLDRLTSRCQAWK
jgi:hypothetical protein